jgi:hypothetical protein
MALCWWAIRLCLFVVGAVRVLVYSARVNLFFWLSICNALYNIPRHYRSSHVTTDDLWYTFVGSTMLYGLDGVCHIVDLFFFSHGRQHSAPEPIAHRTRARRKTLLV